MKNNIYDLMTDEMKDLYLTNPSFRNVVKLALRNDLKDCNYLKIISSLCKQNDDLLSENKKLRQKITGLSISFKHRR